MESKAGRTPAKTLAIEEAQKTAPFWRSWKLDWIALGGLLVTLLVILCTSVTSNTQTQDKAAKAADDLKDHETRLRAVETTLPRIESKIDRIGDKLGLKFTPSP